MTSRKSSADSVNSLAAARWPSISTAAQLYIVEYSQLGSHFSPPVTELGRPELKPNPLGLGCTACWDHRPAVRLKTRACAMWACSASKCQRHKFNEKGPMYLIPQKADKQ